MATTIVTKSGDGAPTASDLVAGELAVDLTNGRLYTEDSGGTVLELGLNPNGNVNVTGSVTADGLTVDGDATLSDSTNSTLQLKGLATAGSAGDSIGRIDWYGSSPAGSGVGIKAAIETSATTSTLRDFDLLFKTSTDVGSGEPTNSLKVAASGDISFYNTAGTSQSLFWDASAEALGIGTTSSLTAPLTVNGTNAGIRFTDAGQDPTNYYGEIYKDYQGNAPFVVQSKSNGIGVIALNPDGGPVGIGTSSPTSYASNCLHLNAASTSISLRLTNSTTGSTVSDGSDIEVDGSNLNIVNRESGNIALYTSATERIRITSAGYTKMSPTGTYISATGGYHEMYQNQAGITSYIYNGSTTGDGLLINTNNENTSNFFLAGYSDSALRYNFYIYSNGNIVNRNYSYLGFSDQKLKQDIEDASRQWDDIKAMKFRKYRWKQDVAADANAPYQLGVIAQELEAAGMSGLVEETADKEFYDEVCLDSDGNPVVDEDGNNVTEQKERLTGESTKSVKYSILTMKALVALQEAMTRIESLEARIAALES
jgi:hypothetical protein